MPEKRQKNRKLKCLPTQNLCLLSKLKRERLEGENIKKLEQFESIMFIDITFN